MVKKFYFCELVTVFGSEPKHPPQQATGAMRSPAQPPMLNKYGKFYARWTGVDGKRHIKACKTKRAAKKFQETRRREAQAKKP